MSRPNAFTARREFLRFLVANPYVAAPGRFPFYCTNKLLFLPSHREQGMEGVLEVVE